jgi:hypothetical protein
MADKTYLVIDTNHMLHRAMHVTGGDIWTKIGLSMHVLLSSVKKCWQQFDADHVVFCLEGKSWRKAHYKGYKANRAVQYAAKTQDEQEADELFFAAMNDMIKFMQERTNVTVLQNSIVEADDLIARWCQLHPDDNNIIVSSDADFVQLVSEHVAIYDGIKDITITPGGIFNKKQKRVEFQVISSSKLKVLKESDSFLPDDDWIEWSLFLKCVRGDSGDNIMSSYPGARLPAIRKAFEDRETKGYDWHNFMNGRWTDHNSEDQVVKNRFEENQVLIDLTKQPDDIKRVLDETIYASTENPKRNSQVGLHLLKFCGKYELVKVSQHPADYSAFLSAEY